MSFDRERIAQTFRATMQVGRAVLFEAERSMPVSLVDSTHTPYLGWVGKSFREASKTLKARRTYVLPRAINDKQLSKGAGPVLAQIEGDTLARRAYREGSTCG